MLVSFVDVNATYATRHIMSCISPRNVSLAMWLFCLPYSTCQSCHTTRSVTAHSGSMPTPQKTGSVQKRIGRNDTDDGNNKADEKEKEEMQTSR